VQDAAREAPQAFVRERRGQQEPVHHALLAAGTGRRRRRGGRCRPHGPGAVGRRGSSRPPAGASEAEVDAAGEGGVEQAELLDHGQGGAVAQLHAARPDAQPGGCARDEGGHDRGRCAGDARVEVVLGQPEALVAQRLGLAGQVDGVGQRGGGVGA
jgi:hypothetical protein